MPVIREPRTAEAKGHRQRVAGVLLEVTQKHGGKGCEVFSPDFLSAHKAGDRWFCSICFAPMACTEDGAPIASNNGVERDKETQRLTVHCSDKSCRKRQCTAIKLSFKNSASMGNALLQSIMTLMRETSAHMEQSLSHLMPQPRLRGRTSTKNSNSSNGGKFTKGAKRNKGKGSKTPKVEMFAIASPVPRSVVKLESGLKRGKGQPSANKFGNKTPAMKLESGVHKGKGQPAANKFVNKAPVEKLESGFKKGKGQPAVDKFVDKTALLMMKPPSPSVKFAAEILLDMSDRIPFSGVSCRSIKIWNTFDRKTRTCRSATELIQQATWLIGQFKSSVFNRQWLDFAQAEWLGECARVENIKHCQVLIQRLETHALDWEAVNNLWQHENVLHADLSEEEGSQTRPLYVTRSLGGRVEPNGAHERWSSEGPVHLCGWRRPKKITFLLTLPPSRHAMGLSSSCARKKFHGLAAKEEVKEEEDENVDFSEDEDEDDASSSLDDGPSPWNNFDDGDGGEGVQHDRGFLDGSPAVASFRKSPLSKSPLVSPYAQPARNDRVVPDIENVVVGAEELPDSSDFEDKAAEFDGQDVSSMSTDTEYGEASGWRSDLHADLGLLADLALR